MTMECHPGKADAQVEDGRERGSDADGHYDIDGVSLACGQVVVASGGVPIECTSWLGQSLHPVSPGRSNAAPNGLH